MRANPLRILLFEDNQHDALHFREALAGACIHATTTVVERLSDGLARLTHERFDVVLLDLGLPDSRGLETLTAVCRQSANLPIIVLTGLDDSLFGLSAVQCGAQDFLVKGSLEPQSIVRAIHYAIERKRIETELRERSKSANLIGDVSMALAESRGMRETLQLCAESMVRNLGAAFARIWTLNVAEQVLELQASAGMYTHIDGGHARVPVGKYKIGLIAGEKKPHLSNDVRDDPRISDREWAKREGMVSFAGHPLLADDELVGVMAMFSRKALGETTLQALSAVANQIAASIKRKQADEERDRLVAVLEATTDFVSMADAQEHTLYVNRAGRRLMKFDERDDVTKTTIADYVPVRVYERLKNEAIPTALREGVWSSEVCFQDRHGGEFPVSQVVLTHKDETGNLKYISTIARDITDRKRAERRIREQAALLDIASNAILSCDLQGRILYWNKGAERLYGWPAAEAIGKTDRELIFHHDPADLGEAERRVIKYGKWMRELRQQDKFGNDVTVESHWTLVRDDQGNPKGRLVINSDITEKKQLETKFDRAQRMESIGALAGGIAHDLNNILTPIVMSIEVLKMVVPDDVNEKLLAPLERNADRAANLVRQILSFVKGNHGETAEIQVEHLVRDVEKMAGETFPKSIRIQSVIEKSLWPVRADATQIHQALLNLCINARDAMPNGGKLHIVADNVMPEASLVQKFPQAEQRPYVRVAVSDTGIGIAEDSLQKIFEPFFTTKKKHQATGFGLSIVTNVVRGCGGFIDVSSEVGTGTQFQLYFPAVNGSLASKKGVRPTDSQPFLGAGESILIVDDEASIRQITRTALESHGYQVMDAGDGTDAVALYAEHRDEIDLVVLDMMMPIMGGLETIRALQKLNEGVRIIAVSGWLDEEKARDLATLGVTRFLSKPYSAKTVLDAVRQALVNPPSGEGGCGRVAGDPRTAGGVRES